MEDHESTALGHDDAGDPASQPGEPAAPPSRQPSVVHVPERAGGPGRQSASAELCCKATASIDTNDATKISLEPTSDPTDFVIEIQKHGEHTSLTFVVTPGHAVAGSYRSFLPIGIALRESEGGSADPTGTLEFPTVQIEDGKDGARTLTLDVAGNEDATWNFFLVVQGVPAEGASTGYDIGIIDPRIKGSAN